VDGCEPLAAYVPLDEIEVGAGLGCAKFRHLPLADQMRAGDDLAGGRLPEHFSQSNDGNHSALNQVPQCIARPNGRKLIAVADHNQTSILRESPEEGMHEQHVHHRDLIDIEKIAFKWLILIAQEPSGGRIDFQQTVDGLRFQSRGLGKTLGESPL
jgi:hypothetical protein